MSQDSNFDFNAQARALLKRLNSGGGAQVNSALAVAAVETALREAFAKGKESAGAAPRTPSKSAGEPKKETATPQSCNHDWEETFLDGRDLGNRCTKCGIFQHDVQDQCSHYFVQSGGKQICVACRMVRGK